MQKLHESDRLARKAAWSAYRAGSEASVAKARRQDRSTINRQRNGSKFGAFYQAHVLVADLSRSPDTDAMAFVVSLATEIKNELRIWDTRELVNEWWALVTREPLEDAAQEVASMGEDWDAFCAAHKREAATQERLVIVTEILIHERKVNPRECRGR